MFCFVSYLPSLGPCPLPSFPHFIDTSIPSRLQHCSASLFSFPLLSECVFPMAPLVRPFVGRFVTISLKDCKLYFHLSEHLFQIGAIAILYKTINPELYFILISLLGVHKRTHQRLYCECFLCHIFPFLIAGYQGVFVDKSVVTVV